MSMLNALALGALLAIAAHAVAPKARPPQAVAAQAHTHAIPDAQIHQRTRRFL